MSRTGLALDTHAHLCGAMVGGALDYVLVAMVAAKNSVLSRWTVNCVHNVRR